MDDQGTNREGGGSMSSSPDQSLIELQDMIDGGARFLIIAMVALAVIASLVVAITIVFVITRLTRKSDDTDSEDISDPTT
jgi:hypothetical protein